MQSLEAHGGRLLALLESPMRLSAEQREKDLDCLKRRLKLALFGRFSRCTYYFMASPVETRQRAVPFSQTGWRFAVCRNSERAASFQQTNSVLVKNFRKKRSTSQSGPSWPASPVKPKPFRPTSQKHHLKFGGTLWSEWKISDEDRRLF